MSSPTVELLNRPTVVLTGCGPAACRLYQSVQTLRDLGAADRQAILSLLAVELGDLPPAA